MTVTWSEVNKNTNVILSNGDLTVAGGGNASYQGGCSDTAITSGQKIYWEVAADALAQAGATGMGIANASNTYANGQYLGITANACGWFDDGQIVINNVNLPNIQGFAAGDIGCVAVNVGSKIWFRTNNGNWNNDVIANQDPANDVGGIDISGITPDLFPAYSLVDTISSDQLTAKFRSDSLVYEIPAGFQALEVIVPPPPIAVDGGSSKRARRRKLEEEQDRSYQRMLIREGFRDEPMPVEVIAKPKRKRPEAIADEAIILLLLS
jgi:hypothetical protein